MRCHPLSKDIQNNSRQRGIVLVLAIIVLILSSSISLSMIRTTSLRQQRFENRQHKIQATLIADSALERVKQQLLADKQYSGEIWQVTTNSEPGEVSIQLESNGPQTYDVEIVAAYPLDTPRRTQASIKTTISLPTIESTAR